MEIIYITLKDHKTHAVLAYKYIKGITLTNVKINSEIATEFGSYVGCLTKILKVILKQIFYFIFKPIYNT